MDVFKEQNVIKLQDGRDTRKKILFGVTSIMVAASIFLLTFGTVFMMVGILLAGATLYGGYYLVTSLYVEYEYILTNGEVDFDKITAQRSRKRLATIRLSEATEFAVFDPDKDIDGADTYVYATANDPEQTDYVLRVKHESLGDTVIDFTPTEEMIGLMKQFLPRTMRV